LGSKFSIKALLTLFLIPGIGASRMRLLISCFKTPQSVLEASARELCQVEGIDKITAEKIKKGPAPDLLEVQLKHLENSENKIITFWDSSYPDNLKRIFDPPAFLFARGDLSLLKTPSVGIVGTRVPTEYGKTITEKITRELVRNGITVVSGFARGVDSIVHKTALDAGGKTIAVLGNGLDVVYPAENKKLIPSFAKGGLILSEYPFSTKPDACNFPKRNRIISGLSSGILVTEAAERSGALLTAMYALDQNREVFALPGPVNSPKSAGPHNLIKQGAKLVQNVEDILTELAGQFHFDQTVKNEITEPHLKQKEKAVYDLIQHEGMHIDQIAFKCGMSTSETLTVLLTLELMGVVRQMAGKMFVRL
jgi:DNA processing protein